MKGRRQKNNAKYTNTGVKRGNLKKKARDAIKRSPEKVKNDWDDGYSGHLPGPGERYLPEYGIILVEGQYQTYQELRSKPFCSVCGYIYSDGNTKVECFCERHGWFK